MALHRRGTRAALIGVWCVAAAGGGFGMAAALAPSSTLASQAPRISDCPLHDAATRTSSKRLTETATISCPPLSTSPVTITTTSPTPTGTGPTSPTPTAPAPPGTLPRSDAPPPPAAPSPLLSALRRALNHDLNRQGGDNSALVVDETTDRTLWQYNAATGRLPASVQKLYTTSTALLELGPDATFETRLLGTGSLGPGGIWNGTLYLRGGGDPTFGSTNFNRTVYRAGATVQTLVARLRAAGIRGLNGRIVADASYFDSRAGGPQSGYRANIETEGALSALVYDAGFTSLLENQLQSNPPLTAAGAFAEALRAAHVQVPMGTPVETGRTPAAARLLAGVRSPRLSQLMQMTNAPSDNFFAEMLLKDLGARLAGAGTTATGASVVRSFIARRFHLHPRFNDGSGLSRWDRTNADQLVYLLRAMQSQPAFWNSLAVAGARGTMRHEMVHTSGAHNCRGKTGTLHDVANLVGYCRDASGHQLVFAFMMNGLTDADAGHQLEDLAGEALAGYRG